MRLHGYVAAAAANICLLALCNFHKDRCCSNMPTGRVLLQDGCLLDHCYSISMAADFLPLNPACLLVLCFSICHTYFYGVSLSAVPVGLMPHYIGQAFWCDVTLSAMSSGVLSHPRLRLLVWSLIINHAHWCGASL